MGLSELLYAIFSTWIQTISCYLQGDAKHFFLIVCISGIFRVYSALPIGTGELTHINCRLVTGHLQGRFYEGVVTKDAVAHWSWLSPTLLETGTCQKMMARYYKDCDLKWWHLCIAFRIWPLANFTEAHRCKIKFCMKIDQSGPGDLCHSSKVYVSMWAFHQIKYGDF